MGRRDQYDFVFSLVVFCIYPIVMRDMIVLCILKVSIEFPCML